MKPFNYHDILESTDDLGIFKSSGSFWAAKPERYDDLKGYALQRAIFKDTVSLLKSFVATDKYITRAIVERADPKITIDQKGERVDIEMSACPLLCLPGQDPEAEIKVFRNLFDKMKASVIALHAINPECTSMGFTIMNNSDDIIGLLDEDEYPQEALPRAKAITAELAVMITADPVLSSWHKESVRMISKMGPWSWMTLTEKDFFADMDTDSPLFKKYQKNQTRKRMP